MEARNKQLEIRVREGEGWRPDLAARSSSTWPQAAVLSEHLVAINRSGVTELTVDLAELSYINAAGLSRWWPSSKDAPPPQA